MNTFDWICIVITGLLAIRGMFKGFLEEFSKKAGVIVGIGSAVMFTGTLTALLSELILRFNLGIWGSVIIAVLLVITGYIATYFLVNIMQDLFQVGKMGIVNHILGFCFGAFEGIVIVLFLWMILRYQKIIPIASIFVDSYFIDKLSPVLLWMLKIDFKSYVSDFKEVL